MGGQILDKRADYDGGAIQTLQCLATRRPGRRIETGGLTIAGRGAVAHDVEPQGLALDPDLSSKAFVAGNRQSAPASVPGDLRRQVGTSRRE